MTEALLVFVGGRAVSVAPGATALAAVAASDPALAERLQEGRAYLTDGRGIRLEPGAPVYQGAILRVVVSDRALPDEADAHA